MKYNFDEIIDRRNTGCVKWDESPSPDVIPLWVADMDFAVAPAIQEAILRRAQHPVFCCHQGADNAWRKGAHPIPRLQLLLLLR